VVVATGVIIMAMLLVTGPTLLSTEPEPALNTAVRLVELPAVIVVCAAVKLVITGAATTVTVVLAVTAVPAAFVTVSV
jgi:TATA-box binding protein (TBP) (component of TFIID and TFIIIB)